MSKELLALAGVIYDAALNPMLWPQVISRIAEYCGAGGGVFVATDTREPRYSLLQQSGLGPSSLLEFYQAGFDRLELKDLQLLYPNLAPGQPVCSDTLTAASVCGQQGRGDYARFLERQGIAYEALVVLDIGESCYAMFALHNGEGRRFQPQVLETLMLLAPHLQRAVQVHRKMISVQELRAGFYRLLNQMPAAVLLLNPHERVTFINDAAERLLNAHPVMWLSSLGRLQVEDPCDQARLQQLVRLALQGGLPEGEEDVSGVMMLSCPRQPAPLVLSVVPVADLDGMKEALKEAEAVAIFLSSPRQGYGLPRGLLMQLYRLTERECDICQLFVNFPSLEGVAAQSGLSLSRVRTYLRTIYQKTGCNMQGELMRLLSGLLVHLETVR